MTDGRTLRHVTLSPAVCAHCQGPWQLVWRLGDVWLHAGCVGAYIHGRQVPNPKLVVMG